MFHDPELGRTTRGGQGHINKLPYKGNIELLLTTKTPAQHIPTFDETITWLMKPENRHMVLNVRYLFTVSYSSSSHLHPSFLISRFWELKLKP